MTLLRGLHRQSTAPRSERRPGRKVRPGDCAGSGGSFREEAGQEGDGKLLSLPGWGGWGRGRRLE